MGFITAIGTANPPHKIEQSRIADFMIRAMQLDYAGSRKLRAVFRSSGIRFRHSVLGDYGKDGDYTFYPNSADFEPFPTTAKRIKAFRKHAVPLSVQAVHNALAERPGFEPAGITHLITVCCTGMHAPGLDIDLVRALGLSPHVQRICINFMGCYAAINALRTGDAFCKADPQARVLIVCTELCSLHFQKQPTDDNLLANALFADGSAAVIMEAAPSRPVVIEPVNFHSDLLPEGEHDMAWGIGDLGFEMKLSSYVPDLIQKGIPLLTPSLPENLRKNMGGIHFMAVHPGGKKILKAVEQALCLTKEQNRFAHYVLEHFGNMSSPSVLFVLKEIMKQVTPAHANNYILSFAFGPGLTLESALLKINIHPHA